MIELTEDFKAKVLAALTEARDRYDGSDANFAKKYGINKTVYSSLNGEKDIPGQMAGTGPGPGSIT